MKLCGAASFNSSSWTSQNISSESKRFILTNVLPKWSGARRKTIEDVHFHVDENGPHAELEHSEWFFLSVASCSMHGIYRGILLNTGRYYLTLDHSPNKCLSRT
jgi:hypothetical protein